MNKLAGMRAYGCGPMDRAADNGVGWRLDIGNFLVKRNVIFLNPCDKPIDIGLENIEDKSYRQSLKNKGDWDTLTKVARLIRVIDLRMVDIADFIIVNLDLDIYPAGTAEEIFLANREKKPILMHCPQGKKSIPDWYFGVFPHEHMFGSWDALKFYLDTVDRGEDTRHFKRWIWFNYDQLTIPKEIQNAVCT